MIWGEIASFFTKKQDHEFEIARLQIQKEMDAAAHEREIVTMRLQNELGIKTIEVQREAAVDIEEAKSFTAAMVDAFKPTGNLFIDTWNGVIRPAAATIVLILWIGKLTTQNGVMDSWDTELASAVLGFFFADRSLAKRGK